MEAFSTSKVTVEYYDPSNLFPVVAPKLNRLFPLRNLNWSSPSRPLRSIDSLHIELVPAPNNHSLVVTGPAVSAADQRPTSSDSTGTQSTSTTGGIVFGDDQAQYAINNATASATKQPAELQQSNHRRHQIPGLRKTPYLKVYLLRCDDNETYKATARNALKDWVRRCVSRESTSSSASVDAVAETGGGAAGTAKSKVKIKKKSSSRGNNQEDHDAFEWLILHVVLPGTQTAGQRKSGAGKGAADEKHDSRGAAGGGSGSTLGGSSKWPGRGSRTLLEKLRSDFNVSGKSAPDRIAQIYLEKSAVPSYMLPSIFDAKNPASATHAEKDVLSEQESALSDIAAKFKVLILHSFGLRVSQYEEDIQERESQKSLPGWNFCTFFMLKEGLARGFESVGLVEDALTVYDELSTELDSVIEKHASATGTSEIGFLGAIRMNTTYLQNELALLTQELQLLSASDYTRRIGNAVLLQEIGSNPLCPKGLNYRNLILSNKISIFEFRCYIFARHFSLLLRLAKVPAANIDSEDNPGKSTSASTLTKPASNSPLSKLSSSARQSRRDAEDPIALADVCQRTLRFISFVSRTLKEDMLSGTGSQQQSDVSHSVIAINVVQNIVLSWSFAVARLALEKTVTLFLADLETSSRSSSDFLATDERVNRSSDSLPKPDKGMVTDSNITSNKEDKDEHPTYSIDKSQSRPSSQHLSPHPQSRPRIHPPPRSSSFQHFSRSATGEAPYSLTPSSSHVVYDQVQRPTNIRSTSSQVQLTPRQNVPASALAGIKALAASRADLYLLQRRLLDHLAGLRGWSLSWSSYSGTEDKRRNTFEPEIEDADSSNRNEDGIVTDSRDDNDGSVDDDNDDVRDFDNHILAAMPSIRAGRELYEFLSKRAMRYYMFSDRTRSGENIMNDLAVLKFNSGDYAAAATYLKQMVPRYAQDQWSFLESSMLELYAKCLKKLKHTDEYVQTLLLLLANFVAGAKMKTTERYVGGSNHSVDELRWLDAKRPSASHSTTSLVTTITNGAEHRRGGADGLFEDLIICSDSSPVAIHVPFANYFGDVTVSGVIHHSLNRDGFRLQLRFRHVLNDGIAFDKVSMHVSEDSNTDRHNVSSNFIGNGPSHNHSREFWLENADEEERVEKGENTIWIEANVNTIGIYHVNKILFKAKNIVFVHDFDADTTKSIVLPSITPNLSLSSKANTEKKQRIHCYPPKDALQGEVMQATHTEVNKRRTFEVGWTDGWNNVRSCELRLKSASAGLRLYTAEAKRIRGCMEISNTPQAGVIQFLAMRQQLVERETQAQFRIPYDLESPSDTGLIAIGMELIYQTDEGEFKFLLDAILSTELPLAVNVHDVFKERVLFSRFQIKASSLSSSTAGQVPVQITGVNLDGMGTDYKIKAPPRMSLPVDVFAEQSLWATYMIAITEDKGSSRSSSSRKNSTSLNATNSLSLVVQYRHFAVIVMKRIEFVFCKDLAESRFGRFKWLLLPRLLDKARECLGHSNSREDHNSGYSTMVMSNEVILGLYEKYRWNEIIRNVAAKDKEGLGSWLQEWHKINAKVQLRPPDHPIADLLQEYKVVINVPMPRVEVLHTVSLITIDEDGSRGTIKMIALGDVLVTELVIKLTRRWDGRHRRYQKERRSLPSGQDRSGDKKTNEKLRKKESGSELKSKSRRRKSTDITPINDGNNNSTTGFKPTDDSIIAPEPGGKEFIYEVRADPDNRWLVSGQRRARFRMRAGYGDEDEEHRFRVFLIPLVTGELLFPNVHINEFEEPKYFDPDKITDGEGDYDGNGGKDSAGRGPGNNHDGSGKKSTVTCETDYLSQSESIVVVPNIRSCTVGVGFRDAGDTGDDDSGPGPDKWEKDNQANTKNEEGGEEEGRKEEKGRDRLRTERRVDTKLLEVEYRTGGST